MTCSTSRCAGGPRAAHRRERRLAEIANAAALAYRAPSYPGRLTLLRSAEFEGNIEIARWHGVDTAGVDEHVVLGSHRSMLREPDVASLAAAIDGAIARGLEADAQPKRTVTAGAPPLTASAPR